MSTTRLLVLGVVRIFAPVHGYDVRRELLEWQVDRWAHVKPGSIYNQLRTLTRDGLVEVAGREAQPGRPERTEYCLTADGDKAFFALLRDAFWRVSDDQDQIAAALCFFPALTRAELIAVFEHRVPALEAGRRGKEFAAAAIPNASTPEHVREALLFSAELVEAEARWARAFLQRLRAGAYYTADEPPPPWPPVSADASDAGLSGR